MDSQLSWNTHISQVAKKLSFVNALILKLKMMDVHCFALLRCYRTLLLPFLLIFALRIWGFAASSHHMQRLVVLQNLAIRRIFGIRSRDSVLPLLKTHHLLPLRILLIRQTVRLIWKLAITLKDLYPSHFVRTENGKRNAGSLFAQGTTRRMQHKSIFFEGVLIFNTLPQDVHARLSYSAKFNSDLTLRCEELLLVLSTTAIKTRLTFDYPGGFTIG